MFANVNHLVNLKEKKITSIFMEEKGFHSLIFVLDQTDEFTKMYHTFMPLDWVLSSGRGRDFHTR